MVLVVQQEGLGLSPLGTATWARCWKRGNFRGVGSLLQTVIISCSQQPGFGLVKMGRGAEDGAVGAGLGAAGSSASKDQVQSCVQIRLVLQAFQLLLFPWFHVVCLCFFTSLIKAETLLFPRLNRFPGWNEFKMSPSNKWRAFTVLAEVQSIIKRRNSVFSKASSSFSREQPSTQR